MALAPSGQLQLGIHAGHKPGQPIPWNLRTHPPCPPSTIRSLQSWRLVTAVRGASTGPSAGAPAALLDQVSGSTRQAPGCSGRLAWPQLRPQTARDQAGDQHRLFLLPHSRSGQGRGFQRRDHLRGPQGTLESSGVPATAQPMLAAQAGGTPTSRSELVRLAAT